MDELKKLNQKISDEIAGAREAGIRDALVALGWVPPKEIEQQSERIRELEEMREQFENRLPGLKNRLTCYHKGIYGRSKVVMNVELKMIEELEQALRNAKQEG